MPRESGAPGALHAFGGNHAIPELSSVVTGSPAFAGDDNKETGFLWEVRDENISTRDHAVFRGDARRIVAGGA
jgi:hypothetical protein